MIRRYWYGSSANTWEIGVEGATVITRHIEPERKVTPRSVRPARTREEVVTYASVEAALAECSKRIGERRRSGYRRLPDDEQVAPAIHRDRELEDLIARSPASEEGFLVYADWLQSRGDPRGELIALQHRADGGDDRASFAADDLLARHAVAWLGPLAGVRLLLDWKLGFVRSVASPRATPLLLPAHLPALRELPVLRFLDSLELSFAGPRVTLAPADLPASLRVLAVDRNTSLRDLGPDLADHLPLLASLSVEWDRPDTLAFSGSEVPGVRALSFARLREPILAALAGARWPDVERLELQGAVAVTDGALRRMFAEPWPALRRLSISGLKSARPLLGILAGSPILPALSELALEKSAFHEEDEAWLQRNEKSFGHLARLTVDGRVIDIAGG